MCRDNDDDDNNGNFGNKIGINNYDTERLRQQWTFFFLIVISSLVGYNLLNFSLASIIGDPSRSTSHIEPLRIRTYQRQLERARLVSPHSRAMEEKIAACPRIGGRNKNNGFFIIVISSLMDYNLFNFSLASIIGGPSRSTSHIEPLRIRTYQRQLERARRVSPRSRAMEEKIAACPRIGGEIKNNGNKIGINNYDTERLRQQWTFLFLIFISSLVGYNLLNFSLASIIGDPSRSTSHIEPLRIRTYQRQLERAQRVSPRAMEEKTAACPQKSLLLPLLLHHSFSSLVYSVSDN